MSNRAWREAVAILHEHEKRLDRVENQREQEGAVEQFRSVEETAVASDDVTVTERASDDVYYWNDGTEWGLGTWE